MCVYVCGCIYIYIYIYIYTCVYLIGVLYLHIYIYIYIFSSQNGCVLFFYMWWLCFWGLSSPFPHFASACLFSLSYPPPVQGFIFGLNSLQERLGGLRAESQIALRGTGSGARSFTDSLGDGAWMLAGSTGDSSSGGLGVGALLTSMTRPSPASYAAVTAGGVRAASGANATSSSCAASAAATAAAAVTSTPAATHVDSAASAAAYAAAGTTSGFDSRRSSELEATY